MKFLFRVPSLTLRCARCHKSADASRLFGDRAEVEIACRCVEPLMQVAFHYPEFVQPIAVVDLENSSDRRVRAGNEATEEVGTAP